MRRRRRGLRPFVDELDDRCLLSMSSGLTPSQVASAYGLGGITFTTTGGTQVTGDGAGETIALIEMYHDPNLASDLHTFDQQYGLPDPTLEVINQAGSQTDSGWGQEESLDVEWAHAIAPAASILVVEAAPGVTDTAALQNLMTAVQTASNPATASSFAIPPVSVVSMSWGFSEFPGETAYDADFQTTGITYIAAAGDSPGVDYPAASPDVLSVGGTTLTLDSSGGYSSETAWYDSGGGYSQYESEPSYQDSVQSSGYRSTPDVAFDGDPNTGVAVYYTPASGGGGRWLSGTAVGSWSTLGGTSLGAPAWAGIIAIIDQGHELSGQPNLTGATQTLPSLYSLAASSTTAGDFHSVAASTTGTPGGGGGTWGGWGGFSEWGMGLPTTQPTSTGETANTQTGLGTPDGPGLITALAADIVTSPLPTPSPSPTPTPTPLPTPTPSPTPTPAPVGGKHHRHKAKAHARAKAHAAAAHTNRVVRQAKTDLKEHSLLHPKK